MSEATQERLFQGGWGGCEHLERDCQRHGIAYDPTVLHDVACWCQSEPEWVTA